MAPQPRAQDTKRFPPTLLLPTLPASPSRFMPLFSSSIKVVDHSGAAVDHACFEGKMVCLYFSAHWCPPCRAFTPELAAFYTAQKEAGAPLEIVFISSDRDEASAQEYFAGMPWLMLDYADRSTKAQLSAMFGVSGIPTLVVMDEKGTRLTTEGRALVSAGIPVAAWSATVAAWAEKAAASERSVASLPATVTVAEHPHPLTKMASVYAGRYGCDMCHKGGSGVVYHCECGFDAHPHCACSDA